MRSRLLASLVLSLALAACGHSGATAHHHGCTWGYNVAKHRCYRHEYAWTEVNSQGEIIQHAERRW